MSIRKKVSIKCDCGKTVSKGSVFCPFCKAEIDRKNAIVIEKEDRKYQKSMRGKGSGKRGEGSGKRGEGRG